MSNCSKIHCGRGYIDCLDRYTTSVDKRKCVAKKPPRRTIKQRLASKVYNLELDVSELRQQLQALHLHRSLLRTRALFTTQDFVGLAYKKAVEYFKVFKRGYRTTDSAPPAYIAALSDDGLTLGTTTFGREMLLEQWRRYTAYFAIRFFAVRSIRVVATDRLVNSCVLRAEGKFHGVLTREALEIVFPSVFDDLELAQKLVGLPIVTPVAFFLHFNEHYRMVRHDGEVDWYTALFRALGDPVCAATIVQHARLGEEDMVDASAGEEQQQFERAEERHRLCLTSKDSTSESMEPSLAEGGGRHSVAFILS